MKKIMSIILLCVIALMIIGCDGETTTLPYNQEEINSMLSVQEQRIAELEVDNDYLNEQRLEAFDVIVGMKKDIDELQPTQTDRFLSYMFENGEMFVFINLYTDYTEVVEAYGYSKTYIYEVTSTEPVTYELYTYVDNDLEMRWYSDYANDIYETIELSKPFIYGPKVYTFEDVTSQYIIIEFESWDEYEDSEVTFRLNVVAE